MLDIISIILGIFIIIQNTYLLDDLHKYHDDLVSIKESDVK